ncbi:MAG: hypothetical protein Q4P05_00750 [Actinomycetaceae bacterium]|nr:hypothetical protein [Actinomycetaceae bacterium]
MTPDASLVFLQNFDLFWLIAAAGGGFFGAAIGGNFSFGFTGILILLSFGIALSTGSDIGFTYLAFGPVFGPHITFAGAAAGAAYAGSKHGLLDDTGGGKDINTALAGLGRPDVLLVGAGFGVLGYVINGLYALIPWFGSNTDTVALTVLTSGIIARIVFGKTGPFAWTSELKGTTRWLDWQEKPAQYITIGLLSGLFAAGASLKIVEVAAGMNDQGILDVVIANAKVLPFAISAVTIFLIAIGVKIPVTHHMTIIAGLAAVTVMQATGNGLLSLIVGSIFGALSAFVAEIMQRLMYASGDSHIDPPAAAIWPMTTVCLVMGSMIGA